jgi:hypothetical protein
MLMLSPQMMRVAFQIRELLDSLRLSVSVSVSVTVTVSASFMVVHLSSSVGDGPSFRIVSQVRLANLAVLAN